MRSKKRKIRMPWSQDERDAYAHGIRVRAKTIPNKKKSFKWRNDIDEYFND